MNKTIIVCGVVLFAAGFGAGGVAGFLSGTAALDDHGRMSGAIIRAICGHEGYVGRAVGLRPPRGVAPLIPFGPFREHFNRWPLRLPSLWSVLRCKTIPPLRPPSRPLIPFACLRRAKLLNAHT